MKAKYEENVWRKHDINYKLQNDTNEPAQKVRIAADDTVLVAQNCRNTAHWFEM